jgi:G3E family GTPase
MVSMYSRENKIFLIEIFEYWEMATTKNPIGDNPCHKTSIILITGYLGSGKSTLIQHILKNSLYKVAVIQNEFTNEMGIESPMMLDKNGDVFDNFMELPNGCLCCSAKDDLYKALEFFLDGKSKYEIDFIVIETNGLADPSNTIKGLWADDAMEFPAKIKAINSVIS